MRILNWLLRAALFLLLLGFAIKNDGLVTVRAFFDSQWQVPLVLVIVSMLLVGAVLGATALAGTVLSLRREIARLRKLQAPVPPANPLRNRAGDAPDAF